MFKGQNGITLVALVITIIVLLILAGVALAALTGNDSIINNANEAVTKYNTQSDSTQNLLDGIDEMLNTYMKQFNK